jgi:hypothetical protein
VRKGKLDELDVLLKGRIGVQLNLLDSGQHGAAPEQIWKADAGQCNPTRRLREEVMKNLGWHSDLHTRANLLVVSFLEESAGRMRCKAVAAVRSL